jgi:hypothetical protein
LDFLVWISSFGSSRLDLLVWIYSFGFTRLNYLLVWISSFEFTRLDLLAWIFWIWEHTRTDVANCGRDLYLKKLKVSQATGTVDGWYNPVVEKNVLKKMFFINLFLLKIYNLIPWRGSISRPIATISTVAGKLQVPNPTILRSWVTTPAL